MTESTLQQMIDAATAYNDFFVPALFQEWAPRVADAARIGPGQRVLDTACGTGVLAREAASRVAPGGSVAGLDINPGMLAVAEQLAPDIEWRQGAAEALPFPDASCDAVVSQFGLMFFNDRRQAIREMLRVLAPGGRLAVAVWDSLDNTPAYAAEVELLERLAGTAAADALRAPFALGDRDALATLFEEAGADAVDVSTQQGRAHFPDVRSMVGADLRGWLPVMGMTLPEEQIGRILQEAQPVLAAWVDDQGCVMFDSPAHIVTVTKA